MKLRWAFLLGVIVALLAVLSTAFRGCILPYEGEVVYREDIKPRLCEAIQNLQLTKISDHSTMAA